MMWFDELYLEKVEREGYMLPLYERYIDDSNQGVVVEEDDNIEEMAVKLKDIADSILPGIIMEESRSAEDGR